MYMHINNIFKITLITPGPRQMGWMSSDPHGLRAAAVLPSWAGDLAQFPDQMCSSSVKYGVAQCSRGSQWLHTATCRIKHTWEMFMQILAYTTARKHTGSETQRKSCQVESEQLVRRKILVILVLKENWDTQKLTCWAKRPRSQNTHQLEESKMK